ncbi:MAG: hypothetical protein GY720_18020, partial [bacterium]|nr:hypothetical protein [bacterium]
MRSTTFPVLLAVLLLLASCSSSDGDVEPIASSDVAALLGIDSSDWADETRQELILGFEEAIQSCMKGNGFDVYPVGLASGRDFQNLSEEELRVFENAPYVDADGRSIYDREFVEQYGYGFVAAAMHDLGLLAGGA